MALVRTATPSISMDATNAIILHTDQVEIAINRAAVAGKTEAEIEAAIAQVAGQHDLPDIFIHINRDETLAMATGVEPAVWPEDVTNG